MMEHKLFPLFPLLQFTPGKLEIQRRENRCILRIKDSRPEDEAEFMCECGTASTSCKLTVTGKSNTLFKYLLMLRVFFLKE